LFLRKNLSPWRGIREALLGDKHVKKKSWKHAICSDQITFCGIIISVYAFCSKKKNFYKPDQGDGQVKVEELTSFKKKS